MRMLLKVTLPNEPFNTLVKAGTVSAKMKRALEATKPEAAYFTDFGGMRCGILIVDLPDPSKIPALAEPWFLTFNASIELHPVMTPEDLAKSGLDDIGKQSS